MNQAESLPAFSQRAQRQLDATDKMPKALRQCVHEFGFEIVSDFVQSGVTDPRHIRRLIHTCWVGPRSLRNRDGAQNAPRLARNIDALLINSGSTLTVDGLVGFLKQQGCVIVPFNPDDLMVSASVDETAKLGLVSKREKHYYRLRASLRVSAQRLWPKLFDGS